MQPIDRPAALVRDIFPDLVPVAVDRALPETRRVLEHALLYAAVCGLWALVILSVLHGLG